MFTWGKPPPPPPPHPPINPPTLSSVEIEASWFHPAIRPYVSVILWGLVCVCVSWCSSIHEHIHTHASPLTTQTLKGIRNISMCDELPQITSPQHFHDIVAVLPHYHNVTAAVWGCCVWGEDGGEVGGGGSAAGIGPLQMNWLIKGSSIKVIERDPPLLAAPSPRSSADKGGWSRGGAEGREASLPLLTLACVHPLHTPRDSRHKCLSAPHLCRSDTLFRLQNGTAEFLIPPARQPTHPYSHLSGELLEEKGGSFFRGGGAGGASLVPSRRIF